MTRIERNGLALLAAMELVRARILVASMSGDATLNLLRAGSRNAASPPTDEDRMWIDGVAWAIGGVARRLPLRTDCLVRTIAGCRLLHRRSVAHDVRLQVGRDPAGAFEAHCWVECGGEPVIGQPIPEYAHVPDAPPM